MNDVLPVAALALFVYFMLSVGPHDKLAIKPGDTTSESCPFCKRLLVVVHADGTFDLAGEAGVTASYMLGKVFPETAECNRLACRLKKRLKR